jgi:hypothetical protein
VEGDIPPAGFNKNDFVSIHAPRVEGDRNIWQGVVTGIPDVVLLLYVC